MRKIPPLKALQAFEAAARNGSFIAAAEELFLTPSAVSHQIRQLENRLGLKLFHRGHRSIELTDVGQRYARAVSTSFKQIQAATRDIECSGKSDILTIQSTPSFAAQWLMPRLARFSAQHDDIDVRLNASMQMADIHAEEADVVIRYGDVFAEKGIVMESLPEENIQVLCPPCLMPSEGFSLCHQVLIHSEVNLYQWRDWAGEYGVGGLALDRGPRFDRTFMAIHAATDGVGVALESALMAERELSEGKLLLPLADMGIKISTHKLLYSKIKAQSPKIVLFRAWLYGELAQSCAAVDALIEESRRV
ncbi:LysR substrate-binding domain-containing protein [Uruburuella testudinis]|uniref:LysR substrate-binding domain-containing protein n=1 Tax=Uruburuella testudinis TaxID=1282863 RepID=A0ABY4DT51_9NEIS|nr:LysR substrate-binding domain-containing protein [Uruburuella testudinis]UOO82210.1 LysR substrate-binding domain-containing protein [Uruburuella testudinis]